MDLNTKAIVYGVLSTLGILLLFVSVLTFFQGYHFAIYEFNRLWLWLVPLAIGFGAQIGLFISIKCDPSLKAGVRTSGTVSGGSMLVCCTHYILSVIPFLGLVGLSEFLMTYQKAFFSIGILSSIVGISLMLNHKKQMSQPVFLSKPHANASSNESITLNKKTLVYAGAILILFLLLGSAFSGFLMNRTDSSSVNSKVSSSDIPKKCVLPEGKGLEEWKEHLGHHADLQECFKYFK